MNIEKDTLINKLEIAWLGTQIGEFAATIRTECTFNAEELLLAELYTVKNNPDCPAFDFADRLKEIHEHMCNFIALLSDFKSFQSSKVLTIIDEATK